MTAESNSTAAMRKRFETVRGPMSAADQALLDLDPGFFTTLVPLLESAAPVTVVPHRIQALMRLAFDASITLHDHAAVERDVAFALNCGATQAEILEVCQLASVLGIHSCTVGVPMLAEELRSLGRGDEMGPAQFDARQQALKQSFIARRGYWSPLWDDLLRRSPDYFAAYLEFSSHPWSHGVLEPKVKEFVYIAIDAATHHLFEPGLRIHIRNALGHGASGEEIVAVLQLLSVEGMRSSALGAHALRSHALAASDRA